MVYLRSIWPAALLALVCALLAGRQGALTCVPRGPTAPDPAESYPIDADGNAIPRAARCMVLTFAPR